MSYAFYLFCIVVNTTLIMFLNGKRKNFDLDKIDTEVLTTYEILPLSRELLHAKDFWVYQDTVLIVLNKPTGDYMIELYSMKSGTVLTQVIIL